MNTVLILPLVALVINIMIFIILLFKGRSDRITFIWLGFMISIIVLNLGELGIIFADGNFQKATEFYLLFIIGASLAAWIFLIFALEFRQRLNTPFAKFIVALLLGVNLVFIFYGLFNIISGPAAVPPDRFGYYSIPQLSTAITKDMYIPSLVPLFLEMLMGLGHLIATYRRETEQHSKNQILLIMIGAIIFILISSLGLILPAVDVPSIGFTCIGLMTMGTIVAYAISKYKLFLVEPAAEEDTSSGTTSGAPLERGYIYFVVEETPKKCHEIFADAVKRGIYGLCMTSSNPDEIRERYGLKKTPILHLSEDSNGNKKNGYVAINPTKIMSDSIQTYEKIRKFIGQVDRSVILIDDINPIILSNINRPEDRTKLLDWCNRFANMIIKTGSILIVSMKPSEIISHGTDIIKTREPMRYIPLLNIAVLEEIVNDAMKTLDRRKHHDAMHNIVLRIKTMISLFAEYSDKTGAIGFDCKKSLSEDELIDALRYFATIFEEETRCNIETRIFNTLEKFGYNNYKLYLHEGNSYIVMEQGNKNATLVFRKFVESGYAGLCMTRIHPNKIENTIAGKNVETYWITDVKKGDRILPPSKPEHMKRCIEDFVKKGTKSIVLLDGLDYLISHGGDSFSSILTLMNIVSDIIAENNAVLIVPLHPDTLGPERLNLLLGSMKKFVPPENKPTL